MKKLEGAKNNICSMVVKGVMTLALTVFMIGALSLSAYAAEGTISASSARVRKEATVNSDMIGSAMNGETVTITKEVTGADGKLWYQVQLKNGTTGYILGELVKVKGEAATPAPTQAPEVPKTEVTKVETVSGTVTGQLVRVREEASTKSNVVTTVKVDEVLTILGTAKSSDGYTWYQVNFTTQTGEMKGFIREDFVKVNGAIVPYVEPTPTQAPVDVPVVDEEPVVDETKLKDYDTAEEGGTWYLVDNMQQVRYDIQKFISAADDNAKLYEKTLKTVKSQKAIIVILVLLLVVAAAAVALLIFKIKDMLDESAFMASQKNAVRKAAQNVMHTVGKDGKAPAGQKPAGPRPQGAPTPGQRPAGAPTPGQRPAGAPAPGQRPAGAPAPGQRPAGAPVPGQRPAGAPVPGQRPAGAPAPGQRPAGAPAPGQRPVGAPTQRPAGAPAPGQRPAGAPVPTQRPAGAPVPQPTGAAPVKPAQTAQAPVAQPQNKPAEAAPTNKNNGSWQPKNFMADEDEFEFEFLNWDGEDTE